MQKTYLSRVLGGNGHLSDDQLYLACDYLNVNAEQREYLFALLDYQRTDLKKRKAELSQRIGKLRAALAKTDKHLTATAKADSVDLAEYCGDVNVQLAHVFLTVDEYRKDVSRIGHRLGLSEAALAGVLEKLERMRMVTLEKGAYRVLVDNIHLPSDSPLYTAWRTLIRVKALEKIQKSTAEEAYNFSVVFSTNERAMATIRELFLEFLKKVEKLAKSGPATDVFQMNFDLFGW